MIEIKNGQKIMSYHKIKNYRKTKKLFIGSICSVFIIVIMMNVYAGTQSFGNNTDIKSTVNGIKFITVGDPQINSTTFEGIDRLKKVVDFVNMSDVDFVVFEGDMTDDGKRKSNDMVMEILKDLKKPYYVVIGNHDIFVSQKNFESYYGPMEHVENVKGYQLLFVGISSEKNEEGRVTDLNWSFDFNNADKNAPTLVFIHGPVKNVSVACIHCMLKGYLLRYGYSIYPELEKFTNLIGVYSGHIHYDSNQMINGTRYVTVNGLIDMNFGNINVVRASDKVGYSVIEGNESSYRLVDY